MLSRKHRATAWDLVDRIERFRDIASWRTGSERDQVQRIDRDAAYSAARECCTAGFAVNLARSPPNERHVSISQILRQNQSDV